MRLGLLRPLGSAALLSSASRRRSRAAPPTLAEGARSAPAWTANAPHRPAGSRDRRPPAHLSPLAARRDGFRSWGRGRRSGGRPVVLPESRPAVRHHSSGQGHSGLRHSVGPCGGGGPPAVHLGQAATGEEDSSLGHCPGTRRERSRRLAACLASVLLHATRHQYSPDQGGSGAVGGCPDRLLHGAAAQSAQATLRGS